jgi:hypothetical protein
MSDIDDAELKEAAARIALIQEEMIQQHKDAMLYVFECAVNLAELMIKAKQPKRAIQTLRFIISQLRRAG